MNNEKREVLEEYYERCEDDNEGWFRCRECGRKVYATEHRSEELALHELREHPER
jgi:hypothetical protein